MIEAVGPTDELAAKYRDAQFDEDIDGTGKSVIPGLVDAHTHPVWAGDRSHEFAAKLAGATYMDIHKMGGGIGFSVRHTKEASEEQLLTLLRERLVRMQRFGTTLAEAKTGYGLDAKTELKMLRVLTQAHRTRGKAVNHSDDSSPSSSSTPNSARATALTPSIELVNNFLIHSIPKDQTAEQATKNVLEEQLPALAKAMEAGDVECELVDVFCDKGIFEISDTRKILEAGKELGLEVNFHGDELTPIKASELAGELGALAVSHLEHVSDEGIVALALRPTVAVLLPTTAYILRLTPPPARKLISAGVPIALGSDFNPNAFCVSMPMTINFACVLMHMTMAEALVAATINAAHSMKRSSTHGSIEVGKVGDLVILDAAGWEHIAYQLVDPPISKVIKMGTIVFNQ